MPRYRSPQGYLVVDLEPDGTFTLWVFDESKPFVRAWYFYEGSVSAPAADRLVLQSTTKTHNADADTDPDATVFVVTLADGAPSAVEAFGNRLALAPA